MALIIYLDYRNSGLKQSIFCPYFYLAIYNYHKKQLIFCFLFHFILTSKKSTMFWNNRLQMTKEIINLLSVIFKIVNSRQSRPMQVFDKKISKHDKIMLCKVLYKKDVYDAYPRRNTIIFYLIQILRFLFFFLLVMQSLSSLTVTDLL